MSFFPKRPRVKSRPEDLAVLGGHPVFDEPLCVGRPSAGNRKEFLKKANRILDSRRFTNKGPFVQEFERRIAREAGTAHAVAVCNGTQAIEIALDAAQLRGEVLVPAFTFVGTAHAVARRGLTPVFCDVDPRTHLLDPADAEKRLTPRTSAILAVHLWGQPCRVEELEALARRRSLKLIFDAAHAFGCSHRGKRIGSFGDAETFSFHATKFIHALEGGAIVTGDGEFAERARRIRNFGFTGYDQVAGPGTNAKMNELCAAMGLTSLDDMESRVAANRRSHAWYREGCAALPHLRMLDYAPQEENNHQYAVFKVLPSSPLGRDEIVRVLHAENVLARKYFYPGCHRMEPYASLNPAPGPFPGAEAAAASVLVMPAAGGVSEDEVRAVCGLLRLAFARPDSVREALERTRA